MPNHVENIITLVCLCMLILIVSVSAVSAFAAGDVAGAIEGTWAILSQVSAILSAMSSKRSDSRYPM